MVTVNRTPLNTIPKKWAFDQEIGPWILSLLEIIRQLREKTGGDSDYIVEIQGDLIESESPINYDIRELRSDRDKYKAEAMTKRKQAAKDQEIASLKAQIATATRQIKHLEAKLNQFIAEVQSA